MKADDALSNLRDKIPYLGITLSLRPEGIVVNIRNQRMEQERYVAKTLDDAFDMIKLSAVTARLKGA
jgi:hypothetical protein